MRTNQKGKVEVVDSTTGAIYTNVKVMYMTINTCGRVTAEITVRDIELDVETDVEK